VPQQIPLAMKGTGLPRLGEKFEELAQDHQNRHISDARRAVSETQKVQSEVMPFLLLSIAALGPPRYFTKRHNVCTPFAERISHTFIYFTSKSRLVRDACDVSEPNPRVDQKGAGLYTPGWRTTCEKARLDHD